MRSVSRAVLAALAIGILGMPYAQPVLCSVRMNSMATHEHGDMARHDLPGTPALSGPDAPGTCHGAMACGLGHAASLTTPPIVQVSMDGPLFVRALSTVKDSPSRLPAFPPPRA